MFFAWRYFKTLSKRVGDRLGGRHPKLLPGRWMNVGSNKEHHQMVEHALLAECDKMQQRNEINSDDMVMRASMML